MYPGPSVRSLFVSDLHLGSQHCQPLAFAKLLRSLQVEKLYLVGDIVDGWLLHRRRRWAACFDEALDAIGELADGGTEVVYVLGNHDRNRSEILAARLPLSILERTIHEAADGRRLLVVHGDCFDRSQTKFSGMSRWAAMAHEQLLGGSTLLNRWLAKVGFRPRRFGTMMTLPVKHMMQQLSRFEMQLVEACQGTDCDGIVYGHTHAPRLLQTKSFVIANTGDWLEHCSAIVETHSGQLELWQATKHEWLVRSANRNALVPRLDASIEPPSALQPATR